MYEIQETNKQSTPVINNRRGTKRTKKEKERLTKREKN